MSSSRNSPPHFVHKRKLSFGYKREYQLLGRVVPPDAAGDPARIRLFSLQLGQLPLMHLALEVSTLSSVVYDVYKIW